MIFSVVIKDGYITYDEVMTIVDKRLSRTNISGNMLMRKLANFLDENGSECEKIRMNPFTSYSNVFYISLIANDEKIAHAKIIVDGNGILKATETYGTEKNLLHDFIYELNYDMFTNAAKAYNVSNLESDTLEAEVDYYKDSQKEKTIVFSGTLFQVFDKYVTCNDRLRYINGSYYKFSDEGIYKLFTMFIDVQKTNFFLENAVRRGVIID